MKYMCPACGGDAFTGGVPRLPKRHLMWQCYTCNAVGWATNEVPSKTLPYVIFKCASGRDHYMGLSWVADEGDRWLVACDHPHCNVVSLVSQYGAVSYPPGNESSFTGVFMKQNHEALVHSVSQETYLAWKRARNQDQGEEMSKKISGPRVIVACKHGHLTVFTWVDRERMAYPIRCEAPGCTSRMTVEAAPEVSVVYADLPGVDNRSLDASHVDPANALEYLIARQRPLLGEDDEDVDDTYDDEDDDSYFEDEGPSWRQRLRWAWRDRPNWLRMPKWPRAFGPIWWLGVFVTGLGMAVLVLFFRGDFDPEPPTVEQVDSDGDGVTDDVDNCLEVWSRDQYDHDRDGIGDACDNCRDRHNPDQADLDRDRIGDKCDDDIDGDKAEYDHRGVDNCPVVPNPDQTDFDGDRVGDACDTDVDGDGVNNEADKCPRSQTDYNWSDEDKDGCHDAPLKLKLEEDRTVVVDPDPTPAPRKAEPPAPELVKLKEVPPELFGVCIVDETKLQNVKGKKRGLCRYIVTSSGSLNMIARRRDEWCVPGESVIDVRPDFVGLSGWNESDLHIGTNCKKWNPPEE